MSQAHTELLDQVNVMRWRWRVRLGLEGMLLVFAAAVAVLVVAAMFAAAMSSLDSGINSIVTVVSRDFIDRFRKKRDLAQEKSTINVKLAKYLVLIIGIMVVLLSSQIKRVPGNIVEVGKEKCHWL